MAVCGPTACGKSELADDLADLLCGPWGSRTPVIVVDSMQVYSEMEVISNQARRRHAELTSIIPVTEKWTVARHARASEALISASETGVVLDAGTGMYLNAVLLDIPIAPKVPEKVREDAIRASAELANPRRSSRALELEMVGAGPAGSIWDGDPRYRTTLLYLRPDRHDLDKRIAERSAKIATGGIEDALRIRSLQKSGHVVNPSVLEAVGVREMLALIDGELTAEEAEERISLRTRQLARKQLKWFDKLARTLEGKAGVVVAKEAGELEKSHTMHDTIWT